MTQITSYGVIPFSRNNNSEWKVLLILHREGNHWGFPKGRSEAAESPKEAARRELEEETGLQVVEFLGLDPYEERYHFRRAGDTVVKTVIYFAALVEGTLNLQEEEIREAKWLNVDEALKQLSFKQARQILIHYATLLNIPFRE